MIDLLQDSVPWDSMIDTTSGASDVVGLTLDEALAYPVGTRLRVLTSGSVMFRPGTILTRLGAKDRNDWLVDSGSTWTFGSSSGWSFELTAR